MYREIERNRASPLGHKEHHIPIFEKSVTGSQKKSFIFKKKMNDQWIETSLLVLQTIWATLPYIVLLSAAICGCLHQYHLTKRFREQMERTGQGDCPHYQRWKAAQAIQDQVLQQEGSLKRQLIPCIHRSVGLTHPGSRLWGPVGTCCPPSNDDFKVPAGAGYGPCGCLFVLIEMGYLCVWFLLYACAGIRNAANSNESLLNIT